MFLRALSGVSASLLLIACGAPSQPIPEASISKPLQPEPEPPKVAHVEFDTLADQVEELELAQSTLVEAMTNQPRIDPAVIARLRANKGITLQWISTEYRGTVTLDQNQKGDVVLKGEQRSDDNEDFLIVEGRIVATTPSSFILVGRIGFDVQELREFGSPRCERSGAFTFRITGDRHYYRLLEKTGRCGIQTDYIDIYF